MTEDKAEDKSAGSGFGPPLGGSRRDEPKGGGEYKSESRSLLAGGIAAILASVCCVGPLLLLALGLGGAWVGNLTLMEPLRPMFLIIAIAALAFAYRKIFLAPAASCEPGAVCAAPNAV